MIMSNITLILNAIDGGDTKKAEKLLPLVYEELRYLAAQKLTQEAPGQTLQATALVHEAYIRLVGAKERNWDSRGHFFSAAAEAMRRILIENARRKQSLKQGGDRQKVDLDDVDIAVEAPSVDLIALDEALTKLAEKEPVTAELVKLRFFAGLTLEEAAQALGIVSRTAGKYWAYARAWLRREISKGDETVP